MYFKNSFPPNHLVEYHKWVNNDSTNANALCTLNVALSKALYPALNMLEITLRDTINNNFIKRFDIDWNFKGLVKYHSENLRKTHEPKISSNIKGKFSKESINRKVVINSNLYYWANIIDPINSKLWSKQAITQVFKSTPDLYLVNISVKVHELRKLRNRIAHYRSIVQRNLLENYDNCREILGLISQESLRWCDANCDFWEIHPRLDIIESGKISPNFNLISWLQAIGESDF